MFTQAGDEILPRAPQAIVVVQMEIIVAAGTMAEGEDDVERNAKVGVVVSLRERPYVHCQSHTVVERQSNRLGLASTRLKPKTRWRCAVLGQC